MAESTSVKCKRDGLITISDFGGVHTYIVAVEAGDFSYDVPDYTTNLFLDRGVIGATPQVRPGDEQPMSLGFSAWQRDLGDTANGYATLLDILHRYTARYVAANWVSTLGAAHDVFAVNVAFTVDGTYAGEADKTVTFAHVVLRGGMKEGDSNVIDAKGTSYAVRPTLS